MLRKEGLKDQGSACDGQGAVSGKSKKTVAFASRGGRTCF